MTARGRESQASEGKYKRACVRRHHVKQEWSKMQQRRSAGTSSRRHGRLTSTANLFFSISRRAFDAFKEAPVASGSADSAA